MWQLLRGFFVENARYFKYICREIQAFLKGFDTLLKISILFEDIFREIEAF
jgi:hypothetical protein